MIRSTTNWNDWVSNFHASSTEDVTGDILTATSTGTGETAYKELYFPVQKNDLVELEVYARRISGDVRPAIDFYNASDSIIQTDYADVVDSDWKKYKVKSIAPDDAIYCRVLCGIWGSLIGEGKFHSPIARYTGFQFTKEFTPEFYGSSVAGDLTYVHKYGIANVINGVCFFDLRLQFNVINTQPEGNLRIKNLPFSSKVFPESGGLHYAANIGIVQRIPLPTGYSQIVASVRGGTNEIYLEATGDNLDFSPISATDMTKTNAFISLSGHYLIDSV